MATSLYAGTLADFDDSMAKAIEDALNQLYIANGLEALPSSPATAVRDRRLLFIAIARGVINHLQSKQAAFAIDFDVPVTPVHITTSPQISVRS